LSSKKIDISLNSYLPSLLTGLENDGINIHNYLNHSFFKKLDLYDPDSHIPVKLLEDILINIKSDLGISSLSNDLSHHFKSTKMGSFSSRLFNCPNFSTFLNEVVKNQNYIRSNYLVKLTTTGSVSKFSVKILEAPSKGKLICEEIDIIRILDAFQLVGGADFIPLEIGITGNSAYNIEPVLPKGDYKLKLNQEESWVSFNTRLLSKKIPSILSNSSIQDILKTKNPVSFKIDLMLDSFVRGQIPNMDELTEMFAVSRRTLERKLSSEGTSFTTIKDNYLQRKSFELLNDSNLSVKEIAEQLNFSNSQNYIRSFKRWTTVTPETYRTKPFEVIGF